MQASSRALILFTALVLIGSHCTFSMDRKKSKDTDFFEDSSTLVSILTAPAAALVSISLDNTDLSPNLKTPLISGLLLIGAYGEDIQAPPAQQTLVTSYAQTGLAVTGIGYMLKNMSLPTEHKAFVGTLFIGLSLCRLWNAHNK